MGTTATQTTITNMGTTVTNTVTVAQITNAVVGVAAAVAASVAVVAVAAKILAYLSAPNHTNVQRRWLPGDLRTRNIKNPDLLKIRTTNRAKVREVGNLLEVTTTTTTTKNATINQITVTRRRFVTLSFCILS